MQMIRTYFTGPAQTDIPVLWWRGKQMAAKETEC